MIGDEHAQWGGSRSAFDLRPMKQSAIAGLVVMANARNAMARHLVHVSLLAASCHLHHPSAATLSPTRHQDVFLRLQYVLYLASFVFECLIPAADVSKVSLDDLSLQQGRTTYLPTARCFSSTDYPLPASSYRPNPDIAQLVFPIFLLTFRCFVPSSRLIPSPEPWTNHASKWLMQDSSRWKLIRLQRLRFPHS
jgi:hypothetical protein